jgi:AraC-like DNA-binding protein
VNSFFDQIHFDPDYSMFVHSRLTTEPMQGYYHYHPGMELLFVHEGAGTVVVNRRTYEIGPGRLFCFQPFQLHIVHPKASIETPYERTIMQFDPVTLDRYVSAFPEIQTYFHYLWRRELSEQCFEMGESFAFVSGVCRAFNGFGDKKHEQPDMLLMLQIISAMRKLYGTRQDGAIEKSRRLRYSERIMQWIEMHYTEAFELDRLAEALHLSKNYVSRVFREETGGNITDYLMVRRVKEACKLLQTSDLPVERIGFEVGLPNASYFSQLFKRIAGVPPLQYRKRYG